MSGRTLIGCVVVWLASGMAGADLPVVVVNRDNVEIDHSCVVQVAADRILDADGNGVIHITGSGITVDFNGARLHGAATDQLPDSFNGIGVLITGQDVTLRNANVSGFKVGIRALGTNGLAIHDCNVSNNFHQRLKSTPQAEDASDWLWPHANDNDEWITRYGAGIAVKNAERITLRDIRARKTQNGIILDRVNDSKIYDNDCSFLSGWGLALWRSNRNVISRNAFDFCIRGYSHGVYNRGQDSAGILMFEQCSENVVSENSATHGGDGFFAFAGKEALGEINPREDLEWYKRRGCNDNIFVGNDFSYAAAHGLELTFSFGNRIHRNTFNGNAICGIWGGYSRQTLINFNTFTGNGDMPYGLERGGINIEHGEGNYIAHNQFSKNACGIHLWWDDDGELLRKPWSLANGADSARNTIISNTFRGDQLCVQLRQTTETAMGLNSFEEVAIEVQADASSTMAEPPLAVDRLPRPMVEPLGENRPVGARAKLAGRQNIVMTAWGPWDHESPRPDGTGEDPGTEH